MEPSDTLLKHPSLRQLPRGVRHTSLIKTWEWSGVVVARYYSDLLERFGASAQALDEREDEKDHQFYQHLLDGAALPAAPSILDIGCGMGNLIKYLQSRDVDIQDYVGVDLLPQFVELCRAQYAGPFSFVEANFVSDSFQPDRKFDLVVNMGVLVSRVLLYERYIDYSIRKMIALSSKYVLFNVITHIDGSLGNYAGRKRVGQITFIPKASSSRFSTRQPTSSACAMSYTR
ncbi:MAG TPA: class I SAM-dependent methyltransferase [Roseiflexaceae bacterium]|nr:class I SAM-dependent methyltransferase [Roseiflexaceae bacterium]